MHKSPQIGSSDFLRLVNGAEEHFTYSDWKKLGVLTNSSHIINSHPRLFRSLSFGDEDYGGCVVDVLDEIFTLDRNHADIVENILSTYKGHEEISISSIPTTEKQIVFSPAVFKVPEVSVNPRLVSAMMPFDSTFNKVYSAIQDTCSHLLLECARADDIWEHSEVIQDIFSLIYRSNVVICDFSGKNPNVFYEAGIAHTLGKHVIPISQHEGDIPFDLRHHRYIKYLANEEGLRELSEKISKRLQALLITEPSKPSALPF